MGISEEFESFQGDWVFVLGRVWWILEWVGMDWVENMVFSEKFDFGALSGIVGGFLGLPLQERLVETRVEKIDNKQKYDGFGSEQLTIEASQM